MEKNGQITIEAILIIGFFILLFVGISMPLALDVYGRSTETSFILEMRTNLDMIVGAIKMVRAGGPGSVRTVKIKSNVANWYLGAYDDYNPGGDTLTYWIGWTSEENAPSELITHSLDDRVGGLSVESIDGINSNGAMSYVLFSEVTIAGFPVTISGKGRWNVKVTNSATSTSPTLSISPSLTDGDTIEIILTG